jgi:hypothetical protein
MIRYILVLLCLGTAVSSCGQKIEMGKDKLLNLYREVKAYDYNPRYWIDFEAKYCSYEILVNDVPLHSYFKNTEVSGSSIPLNSRILSKGKQKLTLKIYPYINGKIPEVALMSDSKFSLDITYGEFGKEKVKDYHKVTSFVTPVFNDTIPYYETIIYFEAEIPYNLAGWTNSVDLTKENRDVLKNEVETIYGEFANYYTNKEVNKLCELYYNCEKEVAQSLFFNKKSDSEELVIGIENDVNEDRIFKIENYELKFYGDGRIVGLIREDIPYKGKSALFSRKGKKYSYYSLLLHRPYPGAPLEVIR